VVAVILGALFSDWGSADHGRMTTQTLSMARRLLVTKPFSMANRYEIRDCGADGEPGDILASAQQKAFALHEHVTFFSDVDPEVPAFSMRARSLILVSATYDVQDGDGVPLGTLSRHGAMLRPPRWHLEAEALSAVGQQVDGLTAFWRRLRGSGPFVDLELLDRDHQVVLVCGRRPGLRDSYLVEVRDARVDGRLAASVAVGLDLARRRNDGSDGGVSTSGAATAAG
jgi:hypothetical protein